MVHLLLIRHGQSTNNVIEENAISARARGDSRAEVDTEKLRSHDPELSGLGWKQAELTALTLAKRWRGKRCLLVVSPMRRALQTAQPLAKALQIKGDDFICRGDIYEIGGCYYEQTAYSGAMGFEIKAEFGAHPIGIPEQGWYSGYTAKETRSQARQRCLRVVAWLQALVHSSDGQYDVIITVLHGELLHRCLSLWMGISASSRLGLIHGNCGITEFAWEAERGRLMLGFNMLDHLPITLRSSDKPQHGWWNIISPSIRIDHFRDIAKTNPVLYAKEVEARERFLFPVDGGCLRDYQVSDARNVHFIAICDGELAGFVQYDPELNRLRQMLVLPDFRGMNIGQGLADRVAKESQKDGHMVLWVHAWLQAQDFYLKAGFFPVGEQYENNGTMCQKMKRVLG